MTPVTYAVINNKDLVRLNSSSGGVFYEIAKYIIDRGGVIFGARFDKDWNVVHSHTDKVEEITYFLGSKYVQSSIGDQYRIAKDFLQKGIVVLFSGTPCQVAGLKAYLGKQYENLITVDFICHGVPSPTVWKKYLNHISHGKRIKEVSFRDKHYGWFEFSLYLKYTDGSMYRKTQHDDLYLKGFIQNIFLRPSCYECKFKGENRKSDITLADFWNVKGYSPEMYDGKGTSLVFINTLAGKNIWQYINSSLKYKDLNYESVIKNNTNANMSAFRPEKRDRFFDGSLNDFEMLKRMTKEPFNKFIIRKAKFVFKWILGRK